MATKRFSKRAAFMLSSMHVEMLQKLADRDAATTSEVVRRLIVEAHLVAFGSYTKTVVAEGMEQLEKAEPRARRKPARKRK